MPARLFDAYYRYPELVRILHEIAAEFPQLVSLTSIGQSYEGRDIWVATVTNTATGPDCDKPALWLDGNLHSPEIAPSIACLYILDCLARQYGRDPDVTYALDTRAFYVCPRVSPDGAESLLDDHPKLVYSSMRKYPCDEEVGGGLVPQDLDGDGRILMMRIPDPHGGWKICPEEPRLMVRREPAERGGQFFRLMREGLFEDFDGYQLRIRQRDQRIDLNRNFPVDWRPESDQPGAGEFPTSEPEVRCLVQFVTSHRNITGAISLHTYSGAILRPYSNRSDDHFPPEDLHVYKAIGAKASDLTGYACYSTYHGARTHPSQRTTGTFDGWLYDHLGIYGWTVDIWAPHRRAGITENNIGQWEKDHPLEDDLKLLAWSDANMEGDGYVDWYPFDHPQLGRIELGGWNKLGTFTNPPLKFLAEEMALLPPWVLWQALISPLLELSHATAEPLGGDFYRVRFGVLNSGWLPTYVARRAVERKAVSGVRCQIALPDGAELVQGTAAQDIGQLGGRAHTPATIPGWPGGEPTDHLATAEWIVRAPAGGRVGLVAHHHRAGCVSTTLDLNGGQEHV
jgi:murein tripeptide amidase MpaA